LPLLREGLISSLVVSGTRKTAVGTGGYRTEIGLRVKTPRKIRCTQDNFALSLQLHESRGTGSVRKCSRVGGEDWQEGRQWRGSVVIDKSFVIMVLACAMAPIVGAGIYLVVYLF
jgi:hypothetical protein